MLLEDKIPKHISLRKLREKKILLLRVLDDPPHRNARSATGKGRGAHPPHQFQEDSGHQQTDKDTPESSACLLPSKNVKENSSSCFPSYIFTLGLILDIQCPDNRSWTGITEMFPEFCSVSVSYGFHC